MQRALENLLSNALKFSSDDSTITLILEYPVTGSYHLSGQSGLRIQIKDQGPGVPDEHKERIFDKYEIIEAKQANIAQVGLGLALCKMVIDAHGGQIFVLDNQPRGAIFTIEI